MTHMQTQQMHGQQGQVQQGQMALAAPMREQEMLKVILDLLKQGAREYTTAVTEANCPNVRQTMQRLLYETLAEQADCYQIMSRQGWYPPADTANRQDVHKAVQTHRQSIAQLIQIAGQSGAFGHAGMQGNQAWQQQWASQGQQQQWQQPNQPVSQWQSSPVGQVGGWQASEMNRPQAQQPLQQPLQQQQWSAQQGGAWQTNAQPVQTQAYDSQAWRYSARQHGGEITQ